MQQLEALNPQIRAGAYLVYPEGIFQQRLDIISSNLRLEVVKEYAESPSTLTFFKTDRGRFYRSSVKKLPWLINWHPFDKIVVYQVQTIEGRGQLNE
jgi:hypothetical protein